MLEKLFKESEAICKMQGELLLRAERELIGKRVNLISEGNYNRLPEEERGSIQFIRQWLGREAEIRTIIWSCGSRVEGGHDFHFGIRVPKLQGFGFVDHRNLRFFMPKTCFDWGTLR